MKRRSWLFVPSDSPRKIEKAIGSDADVIILDLEDGVSSSQKEAARSIALEVLSAQHEMKQRFFIRINDTTSSEIARDLSLLSQVTVAGILLPKTESPAQINQVVEGLNNKDIAILPMIESGVGLHNVHQIAANNKVTQLTFGSLDFTFEMGMDPSPDGRELYGIRSELVLASRVAGLLPPVDTVYPDFTNADGFLYETDHVRRLGFRGKLLIHPKQIAPTNQAFTPSSEELKWARNVVTNFERASKDGIGVIQVDGKMVDAPVYHKAKKLEMYFNS